jgi:hypothetical protein
VPFRRHYETIGFLYARKKTAKNKRNSGGVEKHTSKMQGMSARYFSP